MDYSRWKILSVVFGSAGITPPTRNCCMERWKRDYNVFRMKLGTVSAKTTVDKMDDQL